MRTNMLHSNLLGRLGNGLLKFVVLVVMTCTLSYSYAYTLSSGFSDGEEHHITDVINGITITNNITIKNKENWFAEDEETFVVLTGNVTIADNRTLEVTGATLIIEGNLTIGQKSNLKVNGNAVVVIKKNIIETHGNSYIDLKHGLGKKSYLISYGGFADGSQTKIGPGLYQDTDEQYISGYAPYNSETSTAFQKAQEKMAAAAAANLLPIELTSFTATATNNGFEFNWVTASEVENDYFTLEYSIDGVDFNEIDYVHGAGTTSETSEYEYRWDEAPEFDVVYFRLKQTDYNGEYSYSDVIVASRKKSSGANGTFRYGPLNLQIQDGELRYIQK